MKIFAQVILLALLLSGAAHAEVALPRSRSASPISPGRWMRNKPGHWNLVSPNLKRRRARSWQC
jgi:hypothetical protein